MKIVIDIPEIPTNDKQRWALANGTPYPHGEWKKDGFFAICSECGHELQHYELVVSRLNFCPNCGSDNRKEGDEE